MSSVLTWLEWTSLFSKISISERKDIIPTQRKILKQVSYQVEISPRLSKKNQRNPKSDKYVSILTLFKVLMKTEIEVKTASEGQNHTTDQWSKVPSGPCSLKNLETWQLESQTKEKPISLQLIQIWLDLSTSIITMETARPHAQFMFRAVCNFLLGP
jgi:hypothetical protein